MPVDVQAAVGGGEFNGTLGAGLFQFLGPDWPSLPPEFTPFVWSIVFHADAQIASLIITIDNPVGGATEQELFFSDVLLTDFSFTPSPYRVIQRSSAAPWEVRVFTAGNTGAMSAIVHWETGNIASAS